MSDVPSLDWQIKVRQDAILVVVSWRGSGVFSRLSAVALTIHPTTRAARIVLKSDIQGEVSMVLCRATEEQVYWLSRVRMAAFIFASHDGSVLGGPQFGEVSVGANVVVDA